MRGSQSELLIVYGRRRVGKTELLSHLATGARTLFFEATQSRPGDQLRDFSDELARVSERPLLALQPLGTWEAALAALAEFVGDHRTLVVIDEFQLLAAHSPELESVLSRWWRATGRNLPIVLVLAGSEVSFFEDRVLAGQLYGRRTGQMKLLPFSARDAAMFHPGYGMEDRVRVFSVCGGIPYYLERFSDHRPLAEHLLHEVFEGTGLLSAEAELMLRQSISDPSSHIAVLRSIAHGQNRNSQISQRAQMTPGHVGKILESLERIGLVERLVPITAPARTKTSAYTICDQFLRFHYRFVEPARSQLRTSALARRYLRDTVLPQLDRHASLAWEDICREHVLREEDGVSAVGRWWGSARTAANRTEVREVDVVGVDGGRNVLVVGMCKWTMSPIDFDELNLLDRLIPHIAGEDARPVRYLFSRSGFTDRLITHAGLDPTLRLVTPAEIYE